MEKARPKKGAAKVRHLGRRKAQIAKYYAQTYAPRKLRHILKNNGVDAARSWADKNAESRVALRKIAEKMGIDIEV